MNIRVLPEKTVTQICLIKRKTPPQTTHLGTRAVPQREARLTKIRTARNTRNKNDQNNKQTIILCRSQRFNNNQGRGDPLRPTTTTDKPGIRPPASKYGLSQPEFPAQRRETTSRAWCSHLRNTRPENENHATAHT